ncbi:BgTH12-03665 [Blumeria graminis f. sp. triticale]|uniref:BgTH12-03665 n=1 Tax=Blumeria graminis f. sp. triticale TaxID=1689686 RepID=A0A9W4GBI1_BLUGR|nr:BgTH12-03665 [Blumeria graminis f. sp. triticale]
MYSTTSMTEGSLFP